MLKIALNKNAIAMTTEQMHELADITEGYV
jgi:hypothetical protein